MLKFIASFLTGLLVVSVIGVFLLNGWIASLEQKSSEEENNVATVEVTPSVLGKPSYDDNVLEYEVEYEGKTLSAIVYSIPDTSNLTLTSNLHDFQISEVIRDENECTFLSSAGFYTKEHTPVGLFVSDYETERAQNVNALFDGFLTINSVDTPRITRDLPVDPLRNAVQTGPILIENGFEQPLAIRNDKLARRVVAAVDGNNSLYFIIIYDPESVYIGPMLGDLPNVLEDIETESGIEFADAINLDGGAASTFHAGEFSIPELSPIGSYYCFKD